jgi:3-oxoacyl-[acyl-carrier protein] reductase
MRRALVSGAASPIGLAIARQLAAQGQHVILHAHAGLPRAEEAAAALRADGRSAEAVGFDLTDPAATGSALQAVLRDGPVQILVHNAGIHLDAPMAGMSAAQWHRVVDVSLNGFFHLAQPLLLPMIGTRWGRIVAISSVSAIMGNRGQANYAAAKAGLSGAIRSLSLECAPRGVTANVVAPGIIHSPATAAVMSPEQIAKMVPARRAGRPEEVADLVGFLTSDRAAYITGQTVSINGGLA